MDKRDFRSYLASLPPEAYSAASKEVEIDYWRDNCRFCGKCGAPLEDASPISRKCSACGTEYFPHVAPCVIVLIRKGEEALLVHAKTFTRKFFGLVAGFVETGENLEEAVAREVMEETSLKVKNVAYFGSQAWPFPSQLMIGFTADYESGELEFADGELSDGGFFSKKDLPELPTPPSIAWKLIQTWLNAM